MQYEQASSKRVDDDLRIGVVIKNVKQDEVSKHRIMNSDRLDSYDKIKDDIVSIYRTKKYLSTSSAPIDVGAVDATAAPCCRPTQPPRAAAPLALSGVPRGVASARARRPPGARRNARTRARTRRDAQNAETTLIQDSLI